MNSLRREKLKVTYDKYEEPCTKPKRLKECTSCRFRTDGRRKNMGTFSEETPDKNALKLVEDANKLTDPLAKLTAFKIFHRNNIHLTVHCNKGKSLSHQLIAWALKLTKDNMQTLYEASDWGWNEKAKRQEMTHPNAWYLIVQTLDKKPVGFVHFRFDLDFDIPVLYCYEIQLEEFIRRSGLGRYLMLTLELLARQTRMKKVMLTVFKHNEIGRNFFIKKLRYEVDETSPDCEAASYEILSKKIPNKIDLNLRKTEDTVKFEVYTRVEESSKLKEVINQMEMHGEVIKQAEMFTDVIKDDKPSNVNNSDEMTIDVNNIDETPTDVNKHDETPRDINQDETLWDDNQIKSVENIGHPMETPPESNDQKEIPKLEEIVKSEDCFNETERTLVESEIEKCI